MKQVFIQFVFSIVALTWCHGVLAAPIRTIYTTNDRPLVGTINDNLLIQDIEIINSQINQMKRIHSAEHDPEILQILKAVFGDGVNLTEVQYMVHVLSDENATVPIASLSDGAAGCEGGLQNVIVNGNGNGNEAVQPLWAQNPTSGKHANALRVSTTLFKDLPDIQALNILARATMTLDGMGTGDYWKLDAEKQNLVPVPFEELAHLKESEKGGYVNGGLAHDYLAVYGWAHPGLLHMNAANWGVLGYVLAYRHFPENLRVLDQKLPKSFLLEEPTS
ncbi:hypothetical protein CVT24_009313 [Panaeolus cyanescens]|uniref:Uncharacterized protein n=1 Tax=Panaeolus cyanescens TaxID=181874 RepID=A0A409Y8G6_9AGAR|nr:hypothetical protein CVT24_009313 [Panaeolus cyanescens]